MASTKRSLFDHGLFNQGPGHVPSVASVPKTGKSQLRVDFQPSDLSVICGQGKDSYNHEGNRCFRIIVSAFVGRYSQAYKKNTKSALIFNIVTMIRQAGGHFCKFERGAWFEVGDRSAREKVSGLLRNMLRNQSDMAKIIRRRATESRNKTETDGQQRLVDGTGEHSEDDSSISSACWGSSLDLQGFESLTEDDVFDIDVF
jgi:hypothetical protein